MTYITCHIFPQHEATSLCLQPPGGGVFCDRFGLLHHDLPTQRPIQLPSGRCQRFQRFRRRWRNPRGGAGTVLVGAERCCECLGWRVSRAFCKFGSKLLKHVETFWILFCHGSFEPNLRQSTLAKRSREWTMNPWLY